ncbi:DeoR/GlpR family DNA-binding transcription regulator [Streptosporangium saharense]|uniref:Lactose phosphotransferase system repressor n=1 Tax=Streptosporangium saharense TaxID=1706840 RepID=A0A7W7QRX2_9ACTN|nr:DeoR/GlpR family DNA-binding transcription regulator [Streptosporangium saharense]MBB4918473.1 DeoR/GlpR family transcriptional regulator of sugar metabolism [Streptosporangium saharense]
MLPAERHSRIGEALRASRVVSTEELARELGVSVETIRRDLVLLERQGRLTRVHGGATVASARSSGEEAPFTERTGTAAEAKRHIGRAAAALVRPGQTIVIDVGTTAVEVARALPLDFAGTVATCSLLVAAELSERPGVELLVSGGRLRSGDLALSNSLTQAFFADLNPDVAFLGSGGVDAGAGLTDYYLDEIAVRRTIHGNAARSYVLADSSKFGRIARHRVAGIDEFAGLVTETEPPPSIRDAVTRGGGVIVLP